MSFCTQSLKHQLKSPAVVDFNDSSIIESVNVLRFDGFGWWSSNVDGSGFARVAEYFGVNVTSGACLGIIGGGGAARSRPRRRSRGIPGWSCSGSPSSESIPCTTRGPENKKRVSINIF